MASVSKQPNGRKTIQFFGPDGLRRSIRLGKVSLSTARSIKEYVQDLANALITGHAAQERTARWLAERDTVMLDKLAAVDLIPRRESAMLTDFVQSYIDERKDAKPGTILTFERAQNKLTKYFPADKRLRDVTPGDADSFARWLRLPLGGGLAEATARKTVGIVKQFFKSALRKKLIQENPFIDLSGSVPANRERDHFVTREDTAKILEACPDHDWRTLLVLARFGGLRTPSETLALRWSDIDWDRERMTVRSPKTEQHEGGASRVVPIFPEIQPYLMEAFNNAPDGAEFVIGRFRVAGMNLRTQLTKIIRRAGLKPWPKLWQNLRATRETELAESFPAHVVCAWIGHSRVISEKHYLQVTDAHFERAASEVTALHFPVQNPRASSCSELNPTGKHPISCTENADVQEHASAFKPIKIGEMGDTGLESDSVTVCQSNNLQQSVNSRAAESGAFRSENGAIDAELQIVIDAWPKLPPSVRTGVLALVQGAEDADDSSRQ